MSTTKNIIQEELPRLGEGIYLAKDIANILELPYRRVYDLMRGFWQSYSFGDLGNKAVNFYALIEFYIYFQCREHGMSAQKVKKFHTQLSLDLKTKYPFAHYRISTDFENIWAESTGNLIKADGKRQFDLLPVLDKFLHNVSYDGNNMATRYYPLGREAEIVVDPVYQFGQPIVDGTAIKTKSIYNLHLGGESNKRISALYDIPISKVKDAIRFHSKAA